MVQLLERLPSRLSVRACIEWRRTAVILLSRLLVFTGYGVKLVFLDDSYILTRKILHCLRALRRSQNPRIFKSDIQQIYSQTCR